MKWPWVRRRVDYDAAVEVARLALEKAKADRRHALQLAARARDLRERNGFAEAIRLAMGVSDDDC